MTELTHSDAVEDAAPKNFIHEIIEADIASGKYDGRIQTRFPPEPNGYLHLGHVRAICLNFGIAERYGGACNLRFDDTNPLKEDTDYVQSMIRDIQWLGYQWAGEPLYASDYFPQLYEWAIKLIKDGKAYVDDLSAEEIREYRGTLTEPGKNSPYRDRSVEENLDLFERMKNGEFPDGSRVLRARIDMSSGNINMRDPVLYRIMHAEHHRTGNEWCIYPTYDYAHGQSDSIERVTHSLCTLEFENHRPLYNWLLDALEIYHPQQIEFARLAVSHTITSKRKLLKLVEQGLVSGWDDPRMPTISGMRRRGYPPEALVDFAEASGIGRNEGMVEIEMLEYYVRDHLNRTSPRVMAELDPLKVVITNYPEDQVELMEAVNNPEDPDAGTRQVPFSRVLYIEREDFMEDPPKKFYRLAPGREVRLRYAYFVTCTDVIKDEDGQITEIHCTYDPETHGGSAPDGRKVKATLHWVSAGHALEAEVRQYEHLFDKYDANVEEEGKTFLDYINPQSLQVLYPCYVEPGLADAQPGDRYQFERLGYYVVDPDSTAKRLVFNQTVSLRDQWKKVQQRR